MPMTGYHLMRGPLHPFEHDEQMSHNLTTVTEVLELVTLPSVT